VPASGLGTRLGTADPKALVALAGRPMVLRAVDGLLGSGVVDGVVVTAPPGRLAVLRGLLPPGGVVVVVDGGVDRVESVHAALRHVDEASVILVHDAARCLCPAAVVRAVVEKVRTGHDAVVPAIGVADTLKRVGPDGHVDATVDRTGLAAVQTPQGFSPEVLRAAHARAVADRLAGRGVPATDDAGLVEAIGGAVVTVPGDPRAMKITTPLDLAMAEALVTAGPVPR